MILHGRLLIDASLPPRIGWVRVDGGRIAQLGHGPPPGLPAAGDERCLICPGFIDAHLHLPQIECIGCDGMELLDWLHTVVYPAEARWGDARFAAAQLATAYQRLLSVGTLGFAGYLTSHAHGIGLVINQTRALPLRCIVGQVLMDRAGPQALINQPVQAIRPVETDRVTLSVTPRFAVACSEQLLRVAGNLAAGGLATGGVPIQTHLAESQHECELVRQLFPGDPHYAAVYDRFGLLTPRTLLAHGVYLSDEEWQLIATRGCAVVHCPGANLFLRSGLFDHAAAARHKVRIALGSDVAAGPDLAMPRVARAMIETAKLRNMTIDASCPVPTPAEAWTLITRGNADALGWPDAGRLEPCATADLLILRPDVPFDEHLIGRLIYGWRDDWIVHRIMAGRLDPHSQQTERTLRLSGNC